MNGRTRGRIVAVLTAIAWLVLAADAFISDLHFDLTPGASMFIGCIAVCGTAIIATGLRAKPVAEVYQAGYDSGYRQGRTDQAMRNASENVTRFRRRA